MVNNKKGIFYLSVYKTWSPQQHDNYYHYFLGQLIVVNNLKKDFFTVAFKVLFDLGYNSNNIMKVNKVNELLRKQRQVSNYVSKR
jgi:hypothetical protein